MRQLADDWQAACTIICVALDTPVTDKRKQQSIECGCLSFQLRQ